MTRIRVLIGAMLAFSFVSAVLGNKIDLDVVNKYLVVPDAEAIEDSWFNWPTIREAIDAICANDGARDFESILGRAKELSMAELMNKPLSLKSEVYRMLVDVTQKDDNKNCDPELAQFWIRVYALVRLERAEYKKKLLEYLLHHGESKFTECAYYAQDDYYKKEADSEYYRGAITDRLFAMYKFFRGLFKLPYDVGSDKTYKAIANFDWRQVLANADLKYEILTQAWKMNPVRFSYDQEGKHYSLVNRYIEETCSWVNRIGGKSFETLNLGLAFGSFKISNFELRTVNEFYRIFCVEPQQPDIWNELTQMGLKQNVGFLVHSSRPKPDASWNEKQMEVYWPNFSQDLPLTVSSTRFVKDQ